MGYQNNFLIRTSLSDEGVIGKRQFSYQSPDMIAHTQVENPDEYFKGNYDKDVNMPLDKNSGTNFVYVRGKNKAANGVATNGYVWLYCCGSSLFMKPSLWSSKKVYTADGESCAFVSSDVQNDIAVINKPFLLNGVNNQYFCMVAIVTDEKRECIPENFASYDQFNYWVRTNIGVAVRNFNVVKGGTIYDFQRLDTLSNPGDKGEPAMSEVKWTGLPDGYTVGVKCDAIPDLGKSVISSEKISSFATAAIIPAGFDGYVETFAYNNDGKAGFPENAQIETKFHTSVNFKHKCYQFGKTLQELGFEPAEHIGLTETSKLVLTGECSTIFV